MITQFKFHKQLAFGRSLSSLLIQQLKSSIEVNLPCKLPEQIISMPLHHKRQGQRGFNQADYIARQISRALQVNYNPALCCRNSEQTPQSQLNKRARSQNMRNTFTVNDTQDLPHSIAIIDDVITTGASVNALSQAFRARGVKHIQVWALARTPL